MHAAYLYRDSIYLERERAREKETGKERERDRDRFQALGAVLKLHVSGKAVCRVPGV